MTETEARTLLSDVAGKRERALLDNDLSKVFELDRASEEARAVLRLAGERAKLLAARQREQESEEARRTVQEGIERLRAIRQELDTFKGTRLREAREDYLAAVAELSEFAVQAAEAGRQVLAAKQALGQGRNTSPLPVLRRPVSELFIAEPELREALRPWNEWDFVFSISISGEEG
jgi:hypothetical protein